MANVRELQRRNALSSLKRTLITAREQDRLINKDKLIANICLTYGVSRKTAQDYLKTLVDSGEVIIMWETKDAL